MVAVCTLAAAAMHPAAPARAAAPVRVSADPRLSPHFRTRLSDYVSTCSKRRPLRLSIRASPGAEAAVDGGRPRAGSFEATVPLRVGEETKVRAKFEGGQATYHVRCIPTKFPRWRWRLFGRPQAQWYLFAPVSTVESIRSSLSRYLIVIDGHGVPVWWKRTPISPFGGLLLPDGNLGWTRYWGDPFGERTQGAWEIHRLDGSLVRTLQTAGSPTDIHDMEPLPNGDYLLITYRLRRNVNLTRFGRSTHANVIDGVIQELTSSGRVVWSWNTKDHIRLKETQDWAAVKRRLVDGTIAYDLVHLNSVEPSGNGLVISGRHVSAVYGIDRRSGKVEWKLGGTKRAESLRVMGDPLSPTFSNQHDARVLPDGTVTVYDNRSFVGPPRAVRFRIDAATRTATFLEQVTDRVDRSGSMGSARKLPGGDWVVSWGGTDLISELTPSGGVVWHLKMLHWINYRTLPIPFGRLSASALRTAMNRMHPR